jgi:sensor histidine kinase regulating citrate/malate metabolism
MADEEVCSQLIRLLRMQRHDFINHLQVIHALVQLGRGEKALQYIEETSKKIELMDEALFRHKFQAGNSVKSTEKSY